MKKEPLHRAIAEALEIDERVQFALLFGSRAGEHARPDSDIDLAIGLVPEPVRNRLEVRLELMARLSHLCLRTDVVIAADATPSLAYRIARDGIVVFSRDDRAVTRFIAEAYGRYHDWQRFMKPHRDAMLRRIEEDRYGR